MKQRRLDFSQLQKTIVIPNLQTSWAALVSENLGLLIFSRDSRMILDQVTRTLIGLIVLAIF